MAGEVPSGAPVGVNDRVDLGKKRGYLRVDTGAAHWQAYEMDGVADSGEFIEKRGVGGRINHAAWEENNPGGAVESRCRRRCQ